MALDNLLFEQLLIEQNFGERVFVFICFVPEPSLVRAHHGDTEDARDNEDPDKYDDY